MKKTKYTIFLLSLLVSLACSQAVVKTGVTPPPVVIAGDIHQELIAHPDDSKKNVEFYWTKPEGAGPWPVVIYIHGHQSLDRPGGRDIVDSGNLVKAKNQGIVAVSVSQPGYGNSDGPADYGGNFTQDAVLSVIKEIRKWDFVKGNKIALYGINQGANVASMVVTKDTKLAAVVLIAGMYDLQKVYEKLSEESKEDELAREISRNIKMETGATEKGFQERSVIFSTDKIKTPTLILVGALDDRSGPEDAEKVSELITKNGVFSRAVVFPKYGHSIPNADRKKVTQPFFTEHLGVAL